MNLILFHRLILCRKKKSVLKNNNTFQLIIFRRKLPGFLLGMTVSNENCLTLEFFYGAFLRYWVTKISMILLEEKNDSNFSYSCKCNNVILIDLQNFKTFLYIISLETCNIQMCPLEVSLTSESVKAHNNKKEK